MAAFDPWGTFAQSFDFRERSQVPHDHTAHRALRQDMSRALLAMLSLVATTSCDNVDPFCCGFSVADQGGSKQSLVQGGLVIESYVVTGVLDAPNLTVFEVRPYGARECSYRVATPPDSLSAAMSLRQLDQVQAGLSARVQTGEFQAFNDRSCRSEAASS